MSNYQEFLIGQGKDKEAKKNYPCDGPNCVKTGRLWPAWALEYGPNQDLPGGLFCNSCIQTARLPRKAAEDKAAAPAVAVDAWFATKLRAKKLIMDDILLILPGTPLSKKSQTNFTTYITSLHRVHIDFASPNLVVWPTRPTEEYA